MKKVYVLFIVMFTSAMGMEEKVVEFSLSTEENDCFEWFEENKEQHAAMVYCNLSEKTKNALHNKSTEDELKEGLKDFVGNVFATLHQNYFATPYDQDFVVSTLCKMRIAMRSGQIIKPTGKVTARMYTFTHLLTAEERATVQKKNYLENPQATDDAMKHYGELLADQFVKLGYVQDTAEARKSFAQNCHDRKMKELESSYKK